LSFFVIAKAGKNGDMIIPIGSALAKQSEDYLRSPLARLDFQNFVIIHLSSLLLSKAGLESLS
jgi:S-adenosylmethionine synthetase